MSYLYKTTCPETKRSKKPVLERDATLRVQIMLAFQSRASLILSINMFNILMFACYLTKCFYSDNKVKSELSFLHVKSGFGTMLSFTNKSADLWDLETQHILENNKHLVNKLWTIYLFFITVLLFFNVFSWTSLLN